MKKMKKLSSLDPIKLGRAPFNMFCKSPTCQGHLDTARRLPVVRRFDGETYVDGRSLNWNRPAWWHGCSEKELDQEKWTIGHVMSVGVTLNELWDRNQLRPSREELEQMRNENTL